MTEKEYTDLLSEVCMNDASAISFCLKIAKAFSLWDDLWDQDVSRSKEEIDDVISDFAFGFSQNQFFEKHKDVLLAQIFISWQAWSAANAWESHEDRLHRAYAWFVRDYCFEIEHLVAFLVGGKSHAKNMNLKIREAQLKQLKEQEINW